jgi:hypothetical protein
MRKMNTEFHSNFPYKNRFADYITKVEKASCCIVETTDCRMDRDLQRNQ